MIVYKFYHINEKGLRHYVASLPEKRRKSERITYESIINWWEKTAGYGPIQEGSMIHFEQVNIQEEISADTLPDSLSPRASELKLEMPVNS